jgi:pyruvate formate lyase activating enzyme
VIRKLNFVIMDIKLADGKAHREYTGLENTLILRNFEVLKNSEKPYVVRTPLVPNITDTPENLAAIEKIVGGTGWEKLPYNFFAGAKYKMLGMKFNM